MTRVHQLVPASRNSPHKAAQTGFAGTVRTLRHHENIATIMSTVILLLRILKNWR